MVKELHGNPVYAQIEITACFSNIYYSFFDYGLQPLYTICTIFCTKLKYTDDQLLVLTQQLE